MLNGLLSPHVVSGNRLELWDADYSVQDLTADLRLGDPTFVDLAMCTGYFAATELKKALGAKADFIATARPVALLERMIIIHQAFNVAFGNGVSYKEALLALIRAMQDEKVH